MATNTAPRDWRDEDASTLATALAVLQANAESMRKASRRKG